MDPILFGPWRPDLSALGNPCTVAKNVIARALNQATGGVTYKQFLSFTNTISALSARVRGACAVKQIGGGAHIYAGTDTQLLQLAPGGTAFTDRSGTTYSCAADERWSFASFASSSGASVFACNIANAIQAATVGSSSNFADLAAAAPKARHMAVWGPHLVVGNLRDGSTDYPHAVQWCGQTAGVGDPTSWPTIGSDSAAQQRSDRRYLVLGGGITGLTSGEFGGLVVMERRIYAARADAGSLIFDIQPVEENRGSRFPGSVAGIGRFVFYYADDGFWVFDQTESRPIGNQQVDAYFLADLDPIYIPRICSAIDPVNKLYMCAYPGSGHSGGDPNRIMVYNWAINCWTYIETTVEFLFSALSLGYTLDSLDSLGFTLDTLPFSLDSYVWQGGVPLLGAFDTSHRAGAFTSTAMAARLTTGEFQLSKDQRTQITSRTPLVTGSGSTTTTVSDLTRRSLANSSLTTWGPFSITADGECLGDSDDRYHRFQVDITSGFTDATGVIPSGEPSGAY